MKTLLLAISSLFFFTLTAAELNYKWVKGTAYHFTAIMKDTIDMKMTGFGNMSMSDHFQTTSDFVFYPESVDAQGKASGILYVIHFEVRDSRNRVLAGLKDLPQSALQQKVTADKKGNFDFAQILQLVRTSQGTYLGYVNADEASNTPQGEFLNLNLYAEFDPNSGALKPNYNAALGRSQQLKVKLDEESEMINLLPYDFLELLALPEGDLKINDRVSAQAGLYEMNVLVKEMQADRAVIAYNMNTDKSRGMFDQNTQMTGGDGTENFNSSFDTDIDEGGSEMDMDMGMDMQDMDMGFETGMNDEMMAMDQEELGMMQLSKSMSPTVECQMESTFNPLNGMFQSVDGHMKMSSSMMGVSIEVRSGLQLIINN
jgi:hypothetical protein